MSVTPIRDSIAAEFGIRIEGNMIWRVDKEIAPRQVTKEERILMDALIMERGLTASLLTCVDKCGML